MANPSGLRALLALVLLALPRTTSTRAAGVTTAATVTLDFNASGDAARTFLGHGGVSAGGSSRLLRDYPPRIRAAILDLVFRPDFAAYSTIKVEIGGDGQA